MTHNVTPDEMERAQAKLQALYDSMPPEEQTVLATIMRMAADDGDVKGFESPCCAFHFAFAGPLGNTSTVDFALPQTQLG